MDREIINTNLTEYTHAQGVSLHGEQPNLKLLRGGGGENIHVISSTETVGTKWKTVKEMFNVPPKVITITDLNKNDNKRLILNIRGVNFETCFIPSTSKKLFVILTAVGGIGDIKYPDFQRKSWSCILDGNFLYIDDPTRNEAKYAPAFYWGNKDINYADLIVEIVLKYTEIYNIKSSDIYFISSSNGAFASIYISSKFYKSNVIALNPQISIPLYFKNNKRFEDSLNINLSKHDSIHIYELNKILQDTTSNIFIYSNLSSKSDKLQMEYLCKFFNCNTKLGLSKISDHIISYFVFCDFIDPHLVQPDESFVASIVNCFENKFFNPFIMDAHFLAMKRYYELKFKYLELNKY